MSSSTENVHGGGHDMGHHPGQGHPAHEHDDKVLKVFVAYNGVTEKIEFQFEETLGVLRQRAVEKFGLNQQPHTFSLYTPAGEEFGPTRDQETIRQAGIEKNDKLILRPGVVRGGGE
jgi:hypothetical protein